MIHSDTPQTPSMPVNTYQKLNDIEKILDDVYGILLITLITIVERKYMPEMIPDYCYRKRG